MYIPYPDGLPAPSADLDKGHALADRRASLQELYVASSRHQNHRCPLDFPGATFEFISHATHCLA